MPDPVPNKPKPPAPRKETPPARPAAASRLERQLKVRFYCSMRPWRVQPLVVELRPGAGIPAAATSTPVVVRPVVPGAQVVPAEQRLDAVEPAAQATFQVTPLARGRLPDARVEVYQHGQAVGQLGLRMKAVTQRRTWILALLTLLLPYLLLVFTHDRYFKLRGSVPGKPASLAADPGELLRYRITTWFADFTPDIPGLRDYVVNPVARGLGLAYDWACNMAPDYLPFWVGVGLFGLTVLSWVANRRQRSSRSRSLQLAAAAPSGEAAETLPLSPREQAPLLAQP